jgi:hypothetical protein
VDEEHVRAGYRAPAEQLTGAVDEHHRCDRTELLATFDHVEAFEIARMPRVCEQRAVAQRAWTELAAALKPGHDRVSGQRVGSRDGHVRRSLVADLRGVQPPG